MVRMGETSPYSSMASPNRFGGAGCVSFFFNFIHWTSAKRFAHSTKRLTSGKQKREKVFRRLRSDHNAPRKPSRMMCQSGGNVAVLDHGTRAPGVVARLMGLESLPRRGQSDTPILFKRRRRREDSTLRKKSAALLTAFRCRPEVSCVSPAYIDSRFLCTVARSPARTASSPFLSRLPPEESPLARYEIPEETIPELSLRATTAGSTVMLQGWPLESQRIVPPNIFDEELDVTSTADSAPAMGKRRASRADEFVPSLSKTSAKLRDSSSRSATSQESAGSSYVSSKIPTSSSKTRRAKTNLEAEDEPKRVKKTKPPVPKVRNQRAAEKHSAKAADRTSKRASEGLSSTQSIKYSSDRAPIHVKKRSGASPVEVQDFAARLTQGNSTQSSASKSEDSAAMLRVKRKNKQHHARARSVDDVFPELPLETPSSPDMDFSWTDCKQISSSPLVDFATGRLSVSFKDMDYEDDHKKEDHERVDYEKLEYEEDYEVSGVFMISRSPLVDYTEELGGFGESGALENSESNCGSCWEDEVAELSVCCSGPSVSSGSLPSDVEDTCSSCTKSQPLEIAESTELVELEEVLQNSPPTQFVKKIIVDEELAPQPSPVSIFDSPFLDEPCTPPEPILTGSIHQEDKKLGHIVSTSDKLRQALLDISMFQAREDLCITTLATPSCEPKDERKFIRGVLVAASFLGPSLPEWHGIDPSLFDKLESGDIELGCPQASGGLWRCDRRLLFDCVNEALVEEGVVLCRPRGECLVVEVGKQIDGWRALASRSIDSLIEWDMGSRVGSWKTFGCEVEEVGVQVERSVWEDLLDELVYDLVWVSCLGTLLNCGVD